MTEVLMDERCIAGDGASEACKDDEQRAHWLKRLQVQHPLFPHDVYWESTVLHTSYVGVILSLDFCCWVMFFAGSCGDLPSQLPERGHALPAAYHGIGRRLHLEAVPRVA